MTETSASTVLDGDRPLSDHAADRLGFSAMATALAKSILAQTPTAGLVIGLEGAWGSGKSSLLNLTLATLRELEKTQPVKVLEFRPWLIGDRDQLLNSLFADLAAIIDEIGAENGDLTGKSVSQTKAVAEGIRQFATRLSGPGKIISAAKLLVPGAELIGGALEALASAASDGPLGPTLAELKDKVANSLKELGVPIVVTIDDVDRLEPGEVLELLRLVRSVADLPNVIYLLCYDHEVLAKAIESAAAVSSGSAFLEKIVQVVVQAPKPEPYDLRAWFSRDLELLASPIGPDEASRIQHVIDIEGGKRLGTPRAVVRALNSLRFDLPAVAGRVDMADLVWLHLIKTSNTCLYRWIEEYCGAYASTSNGRAHLSQAAIIADNQTLQSILNDEGRVLQDEIYNLANHLPGIRRMHAMADEAKPFIWENPGKGERDIAIIGKRLSSPDHYRLYFALTVPSVAPQMSDFTDLEAALTVGPEAVEALLLKWGAEKSSLGVSRLELIFERLNGGGYELEENHFEKLWIAFSEIFDGPLSEIVVDVWGRSKLWVLARPIIENGFRSIPTKSRNKLLKSAFENGRALAWMADFFRDEIFAHGRVQRDRVHGRPAFSAAALDIVTPIILARLAQTGVVKLLALPNGYGNLLAWAQGAEPGEKNPARLEVARVTRSNEGLIDVLEKLRSRTFSIGGDGRPQFDRYLGRPSVSLFLDYDEMKLRLESISNGRRTKLTDRAKALLHDVENARNY